MFQVQDVFDEAQKISAVCDEDKLFRWITDAIEMIVNKADFEGWIGYLDLCVSGRCVTLPREVECILAVNIAGRPTLGRNQLFTFHLNGPGDNAESIDYSYQDTGFYPTYRDIAEPTQLIAFVDKPEDEGATLRVYGYDENGVLVRQKVSGVWQDGYLIPTLFGLAVPDVDMPKFSRITRVQKARTQGDIRLSTVDSAGTSGVTLGIYEPDEQEPHYRRIKLGREATWIRIAYRKATQKIYSKSDRVPLYSRQALLFAMRSLKYYDEADLAMAHAYEADAVRLEKEASDIRESPNGNPIQVVDLNNLQDKTDFEIV